MDTWPCEEWEELVTHKKKKEDIRKKVKDEQRKIDEHFFNDVHGYSDWINYEFNHSALLNGAANLLIKYAYCENCQHYVGPNPIQRKLYKIAVISGYCTMHVDTTTPEFRCSSIRFDPLWKQIIEMKLAKIRGYDPSFDKRIREERLRIKHAFENGTLDEY